MTTSPLTRLILKRLLVSVLVLLLPRFWRD